MCIYGSVLLRRESLSSPKTNISFYFKMSHPWKAIVAIFFLSTVACESCEYEEFTPDHSACKPRNAECEFENNLVTDDDKAEILKLHNDFRNEIATGRRSLKKGRTLTSSNMRELEWDDELAYIAQKHAETCTPDYDCEDCRRVDRFRRVGQAIYEASSANFPEEWKKMMEAFRDKRHNQLIWAETWKIGCGKVEIQFFGEGKALIVCNYAPGGYEGVAAFKPGEPCSFCPSRTCCGHYCTAESAYDPPYEALCRVDACKYENFSPEHIGCREDNTDCAVSNTKVTNKEKSLFIKLLNRYREEAAFGKLTFGNNTLPPVRNMRELEWDSELAELAQRQANLCEREIVCPECRKVDRFDVGQIVYVSTNTTFPRVWQNMVESYVQNCEHLSQIISADTWRIGCGKAIMLFGQFTDLKTLIVCNFGPEGKLNDLCGDVPLPEEEEEVGSPCTKCPAETCCGSKCAYFLVRSEFTGLCKSTKHEEDLSGCEYNKFTPNHIGCDPGNPLCNVFEDGVREEEKYLILKLHNDYRENIAMGRTTAEEEGATNMRVVVWDIELAYLAQKHAETCNPTPYCDDCRKTDRFDYVGQRIYESSVYKSWIFNYTSELEKMLNPDDLNEEQVAQLLWAETWRLGCGKTVYEELGRYKMLVICNYGPGAKSENITDGNIYNRGSPCTECPEKTCCGDLCNKFGVSAYYEGLCRSNLIDTPGFEIEFQRCKYRKFSVEHAGCKPRNLTCNILKNIVTDYEKNAFIDVHNYYREFIAMNKSNLLAGAANMREMEWDDELAMLAQRHAETCNKDKDCYNCRRVDRFDVNQIIYTSKTKLRCESYNMIAAMKQNPDGFRQLMRAESWRMGCGQVEFEEGSSKWCLIVCNYGPDIIPSRKKTEVLAFKRGPQCTACPVGTCCGEACKDYGVETGFLGLCKSLFISRKEPSADFELLCRFSRPADPPPVTEHFEPLGCKLSITRPSSTADLETADLDFVECGLSETEGSSTVDSLTCRFPSAGELKSSELIVNATLGDFEFIKCALPNIGKSTEGSNFVECGVSIDAKLPVAPSELSDSQFFTCGWSGESSKSKKKDFHSVQCRPGE